MRNWLCTYDQTLKNLGIENFNFDIRDFFRFEVAGAFQTGEKNN